MSDKNFRCRTHEADVTGQMYVSEIFAVFRDETGFHHHLGLPCDSVSPPCSGVSTYLDPLLYRKKYYRRILLTATVIQFYLAPWIVPNFAVKAKEYLGYHDK
jgi:hypothetical protein